VNEIGVPSKAFASQVPMPLAKSQAIRTGRPSAANERMKAA